MALHNTTKAKLVILPILGILFLTFFIFELQSYLGQTPLHSISIEPAVVKDNPDPTQSNQKVTQIPLPAFLFRIPFGSETLARLLEYNRVGVPDEVPPIPPNNTEPFYLFGKREEPQSTAANNYWNFQYKSFDNSDPRSAFLLPNHTLILLTPKAQYIDTVFDFYLNFDVLRDFLNGGSLPENVIQVTTYGWILGSRFTQPGPNGATNDFGFNPKDLDLERLPDDFPDSFYAFSNLTSGVVNRDVNPFVSIGDAGQQNYAIKANEFLYQNGSQEYFFELTKTGGRTNLGIIETRTVLKFEMLLPQITTYTEFLAVSPTAAIGAIMAAFQVLIVLGFILCFGRGRYSPYGLIHFILPKDSVPQYQKVPYEGQPPDEYENDKFNFYIKEYLDTNKLAELDAEEYGRAGAKRPFPYLTVVTVFTSVLALILLCFAGMAGYSPALRGLYFLKISDAQNAFFVSLWGYCTDTACHLFELQDLFSEISITSATTLAEVSNIDLSSVLSSEKNGFGFAIISAVIAMLLIIMVIKLLSPMVTLIRELDLVGLPILVSLTVIGSLFGMGCMLYYYIRLRDFITANNANAELGNAIALVILAVLAIMVLAASVFIDSKIRIRQRNDRFYENDMKSRLQNFHESLNEMGVLRSGPVNNDYGYPLAPSDESLHKSALSSPSTTQQQGETLLQAVPVTTIHQEESSANILQQRRTTTSSTSRSVQSETVQVRQSTVTSHSAPSHMPEEPDSNTPDTQSGEEEDLNPLLTESLHDLRIINTEIGNK